MGNRSTSTLKVERGWVFRAATNPPKEWREANVEMVFVENGVDQGYPAYLWSPDPDSFIPRLNESVQGLNSIVAEMWGV